jgi:F0F1-type ATP synthase epsilon subunit
MSKLLQLKIVTPEKLILEEEVESVTIPTTEGEITVLADHIPLNCRISFWRYCSQNSRWRRGTHGC